MCIWENIPVWDNSKCKGPEASMAWKEWRVVPDYEGLMGNSKSLAFITLEGFSAEQGHDLIYFYEEIA